MTMPFIYKTTGPILGILLLLLDEPFSNLDPDTKRDLWAQIDRLRRQFSITLLVVTHDPAEAAALANRTLTLNNGRLELPAAPLQPRFFSEGQTI